MSDDIFGTKIVTVTFLSPCPRSCCCCRFTFSFFPQHSLKQQASINNPSIMVCADYCVDDESVRCDRFRGMKSNRTSCRTLIVFCWHEHSFIHSCLLSFSFISRRLFCSLLSPLSFLLLCLSLVPPRPSRSTSSVLKKS